MRWEEYREQQRRRAPARRAAAAALRAGDPEPARSLLRGLFLTEDAVYGASLLALLRASPPAPRPGLLRGVLLGEARPPPDTAEDLEDFLHREWAAEHGLAGPIEPEDPCAWALDELCFLAEETERRERRAWACSPADPAADQEALATWLCWFEGGALAIQAAGQWLRRHGAALERAFNAVRAHSPVSAAPQGVALRTALQRAFLNKMTQTNAGVPGWLDVAVRTLESTPDGAITALTRCLDEDSRRVVADCLVRRRSHAETARWLWPSLPPAWRAEHLNAQLRDPRALDSFAAAHAGRWLVRAWARGRATHPETAWGVARACRRRHRLRAAAATADPARLAEALGGLDALHQRTGAALARYALDWAWQENAAGWAFGERPLTPRCEEPQPLTLRAWRVGRALDGVDPGEGALRTWVLKVLLRGYGEALKAWVQPGTPSPRDGFQDLLQEIPRRCRPRRSRALSRAAAALWADLDAHAAALEPVLVALARVDLRGSERRVRAQVRALLDAPGLWDPSVRPIRKGLERCVRAARAWLGPGYGDGDGDGEGA